MELRWIAPLDWTLFPFFWASHQYLCGNYIQITIPWIQNWTNIYPHCSLVKTLQDNHGLNEICVYGIMVFIFLFLHQSISRYKRSFDHAIWLQPPNVFLKKCHLTLPQENDRLWFTPWTREKLAIEKNPILVKVPPGDLLKRKWVQGRCLVVSLPLSAKSSNKCDYGN